MEQISDRLTIDQKENIFNEFLNISGEAIVVLESNLSIVFFNKLASEIYSWDKDEYLGKNYLKFCENNNIQPFAPKKMFLDDSMKSFNNFENSIVQTNVIKVIMWNIFRLNIQETNYLFAIGKDYTNLRELEKKEKNTRESLQNIISHIPGYVFWKDTNCVLMGCNESFATLAGETTQSIVGKTDYELPWKLEEAEHFIYDDKEVIETGTAKLNIEEPMRGSDGSQVFLLTHKVPLRDPDNKIIGVIGICSDITARKKAEEELILAKESAEAANRAKTEFLQNMSHDIRTPFVGILEMAKHIKEKEINKEKLIELGYIIESSERLLAFLNEVIELIKIESSNNQIVLKDFNLKDVIDDVVGIMRAQIYQKKLEMIVKYTDNFPETIVNDQLRIHRILLNLISNAIKFTKSGQIIIGAEVFRQEYNVVLIKLTIEDTGIGIPQDKIDYIFEDFNKISPSYCGIYTGAGLGLKIVKQFINDIKGKIQVESEEGQGTKFICIIPCKIKI